MASDRPGILSTLSLGGRRVSGRSEQPVTHPLLGATASSSSITTSSDNLGEEMQDRTTSDSATGISGAASHTGTGVLPYTPYRPRQRGGTHNQAPVPPSPPLAAASTTSSPAAAIVTATPTSALSASASTSASTAIMTAVPADPLLDAAAAATATSRLQLQSLKAGAQRIGLGNGSMGMGMIDAIFDKGARGRTDAGDWADLLKVLTSSKAVILLPSSPASSLPMTPQTLRDHIAFVSSPISSATSAVAGSSASSSSMSVLVTLSGLVGTLSSNGVSFESSVPADSPLILALRDDAQRVGVLSRLRPTQPSPAASFPSFTVSSDTTLLSFPALGKAVPVAVDKAAAPKEVPRRINPFASFFGGGGPSAPSVSSSTLGSPSRTGGQMSPERPSSPSPLATSSNLPSPRPSITSLDNADIGSPDAGEGYSVLAYSINKPVRFNEVYKALVKSVRSTVRTELDGLPERVIDKVLRLVVGSVCPVSGGVADQALLKSHHQGLGVETDGSIPIDFSDPTSTGERLQDFMEAIYDDLIEHYRDAGNAKRTSEDNDAAGVADKEAQVEKVASDGTERVEGLVCRLLYNRIFSPLQSDDARHDEALASRIAALNLLDLSLDHLGLITRPPREQPKGAIAAGLDNLVADVGRELQKLATLPCLTPKDKADVLVQAHKIAVDGLARLPPVELRPEGEPYVSPPEDEDGEEEEEEKEDEDEVLPAIEEAEHTPEAFEKKASGSVPALQLTTNALDEALSDSVHTVVPPNAAVERTESPIEEKATEELSPATEKAEAPPKPSTSGADLILPLIIYAVVKANPAQLASQLMYLRRYRSAICLVGEASYAIVNLTAVVEFIEHVQLSELGLGDSEDRVMSVEDLSPIGLTYLDDGNADTASIASASSRLRGRVFQVGELAGTAAGSANKVINSVVDSSWSAVRGFMGTTPQVTATPPDDDNVVSTRPMGNRPRQASTFSLASVTASVANIAAAATTAAARNRSRAGSHASDRNWSGERELVEVAGSRPSSILERGLYDQDSTSSHGESDDESPGLNSNPHVHVDNGRPRARSDARSIMSVSSMMSRDRSERELKDVSSSVGHSRDPSTSGPGAFKRDPANNSIGNRLAQIGAFGRLATPPSSEAAASAGGGTGPASPDKGFFATLGSRSQGGRGPRGSLSAASVSGGERRADSLKSPTPSINTQLSHTPEEGAGPPLERFMTCEVGELKMGEVAVLLRDYRRLARLLARAQGVSPPPGGAQ